MAKHPFHHHYDRAQEQSEQLDRRTPSELNYSGGLGVLHGLMALVWVQTAQWRELRKIRKLLEASTRDNVTTSFNLSGHTTPKEGGR